VLCHCIHNLQTMPKAQDQRQAVVAGKGIEAPVRRCLRREGGSIEAKSVTGRIGTHPSTPIRGENRSHTTENKVGETSARLSNGITNGPARMVHLLALVVEWGEKTTGTTTAHTDGIRTPAGATQPDTIQTDGIKTTGTTQLAGVRRTPEEAAKHTRTIRTIETVWEKIPALSKRTHSAATCGQDPSTTAYMRQQF
jgi:hypothetical protein